MASVTHLSAHPLPFVGLLAVLYVARPFLMWPVSVLSVTVGFVLGVEYGVPVAVAGTLLSNSIVFLVARHARTQDGPVGLASRSSDRFVETTGELRGVVAARLAPLPADVVSSAAGLSEVSFGAYLLGTLLGESPWIIAEVVAGASMHTLSVAEMRAGQRRRSGSSGSLRPFLAIRDRPPRHLRPVLPHRDPGHSTGFRTPSRQPSTALRR
jgi:uncharacterized membrane protein YdjX (TVP38/TMEM64 family)